MRFITLNTFPILYQLVFFILPQKANLLITIIFDSKGPKNSDWLHSNLFLDLLHGFKNKEGCIFLSDHANESFPVTHLA